MMNWDDRLCDECGKVAHKREFSDHPSSPPPYCCTTCWEGMVEENEAWLDTPIVPKREEPVDFIEQRCDTCLEYSCQCRNRCDD